MSTRTRHHNNINPNHLRHEASAEDWLDAGFSELREESAELVAEIDKTTNQALSVDSERFNRSSLQTDGQ